jgi:hypothetical protein
MDRSRSWLFASYVAEPSALRLRRSVSVQAPDAASSARATEEATACGAICLTLLWTDIIRYVRTAWVGGAALQSPGEHVAPHRARWRL